MPPKSKHITYNPYTAQNIKSFDRREHVRLRPGMYIGGTDSRALHHMIYEVLDDVVENALNGECDHIELTQHHNRTITISTNDKGSSTELNEAVNVPYYLVMMEALYSKRYINGNVYLVSGGLHGVGISATNALSSACIAEVWRDGFHWRQEYSEGLPIVPVQRIPIPSDASGTRMTFTPDYSIMEDNDFDFLKIAARCRELSYLVPQVTFTVRYEGPQYCLGQIYCEDSLVGWLHQANRLLAKCHDPIHYHEKQQIPTKSNTTYSVEITFALQYVDANTTHIKSYVNSIEPTEGGTHVDGFRKAIAEVINACIDETLTQVDIENGLIAILHLKHPDPQFESQTRIKLLNPEVEDAVYKAVKNGLSQEAEVLESIAQQLAEKSRKAKYVRVAPDTNCFFKD